MVDKLRLIKLINTLPLSSEILGSPRGFYPSTLAWVNGCQKSQNQLKASYITVHPQHTIYRNCQPKSIGGEIPLEFQNELQKETPETFVVTIPEGRTWSDCAVITPDDRILADISKVYAPVEEHPIFRKWKLRPAKYVNSTVAVLAVLSGDHNYFHWMFEVLPRLEILLSSGINIDEIDYFFANDCRYSFQKETLAMLGIPAKKIIECTKISHVKAKRLIVPSLPGNTFDIPSWVCDFLRKKFLHSEIESKFDRKRIYINRSDAKYRRILNETEVINFLGKLGFESVTLGSMTVAEQVKLFASADVIVSPHGAGLANLVFCQPETKIIELFPPGYAKPYYWFISNHIPLDYYLLLGETDEKIQVNEFPDYQKNFLIDLEKISQILDIAKIE